MGSLAKLTQQPLPYWIDLLVAADRDALHEIEMSPIRRGSLEETAQMRSGRWKN